MVPEQHQRSTKKISPVRLRFLGIALLVIISTSAGFIGGRFGAESNGLNSQGVQKQEVVLKSQGQLISDIAKNVGASVVSVEVQGTTTSDSGLFGLPTTEEQDDAGTGIILNKQGLIVTNRHVVPDGTTSVSVTLSDGTHYNNVQIVGRTPDSDPLDIAFLKIQNTNGHQLTPAIIGDSSQAQVGDSVVAIGNALGEFQNTVTSGIISGFGREVQASDSSGSSTESLDDLIQTDAAINEGNSGGPLVDMDGEVIGINTAVAGDAQNIGFAIPINDVKGLISSVEATGQLKAAYLGIVFVPITADVAQYYNLNVTQGAYIPPSSDVGQDSVVSGGPAAAAGIQPGDIITKINNDTVTAQQGLTSLINKYQPGDKISVTLIRSGKTLTKQVTLGTAPSS